MDDTELVSNCENCIGLCCVAPPFAKSNEFAYAKAEGEPCQHLTGGYHCSIHDDLASSGFTGCVKFECYGAGQKITQHHFKNQSWRDDHLTAKRMFHIFLTVKALHLKIIGLNDAGEKERIKELERLSYSTEDNLLSLDLDVL